MSNSADIREDVGAHGYFPPMSAARTKGMHFEVLIRLFSSHEYGVRVYSSPCM